MKNRYFLMRHGESFANRKEVIVSRPQHGLNHYGLTSLGAEQVTRASVNTRLNDCTMIISSDYRRALESAQIVHDVICAKTAVSTDRRLRERDFGQWELKDDRHYESVWEQDFLSPDRSQGNVETVTSVFARTLALLSELEAIHQDKTILLVGHGDVLQILLTGNQGLDPRFHRSQPPLKNAEIRRLYASMRRMTA